MYSSLKREEFRAQHEKNKGLSGKCTFNGEVTKQDLFNRFTYLKIFLLEVN